MGARAPRVGPGRDDFFNLEHGGAMHDIIWEPHGDYLEKANVTRFMRRHGIANPYEHLKALTRGRRVGREQMRRFIEGLELPDEARDRLLSLTPGGYVGNAAAQARNLKRNR